MALAGDSVSRNSYFYLKRYWGYDNFRVPQEAVVNCLYGSQDALVLLPTGAGKSLCFQLPAVMQTGVTIVVSPLVSLMENQVAELKNRQISAALLHSQLSSSQRKLTLGRLEQQQLKLLYVAPETLLSPSMWKRLQASGANFKTLIVDEAHCLVQWGTTFRPIYRRLGALRATLNSGVIPVTMAAFTATADPQTQAEIQSVLQLRCPKVFRTSPYRSNLALRVEIAWTPYQRRQRLIQFIQRQQGHSGLIYTRSRRESEVLAQQLLEHHFVTTAYHAGLGAEERRRIEQAWLSGALPFVICTCAFGMGINKSDVRWILHYHPPLTLNEYVQEIGRAGRDGKRSQMLMLVSEPTGILDNHDRQQRQYFLDQLTKQLRAAQQLVPRLPRQGHIPDVVAQYPQAEMALSLLHSTQQLKWEGPMNYRIMSNKRPTNSNLNTLPVETMAQFIRTKRCRWQFILQSFGFTQEAKLLSCGCCDRCQRQRG